MEGSIGMLAGARLREDVRFGGDIGDDGNVDGAMVTRHTQLVVAFLLKVPTGTRVSNARKTEKKILLWYDVI